MLLDLWQTEIQVLPVVITLILIETPGLIRTFLQIPYVPVYFSLFPFNVLNQDISIYLDEDYFYGRGSNLTEEEKATYRRVIFQKAALSLMISLGLIPFFGGFLSAFILPEASLLGFCLIFIAYKLIGITRAAIDFGHHTISNAKSMALYITVYGLYFLIFLKLFHKSYNWTIYFVGNKNWLGLASELIELFVVDFIFLTLIVGGLAGILLYRITNKGPQQP